MDFVRGRGHSLGRVLSDLVRCALTPSQESGRNGVPILPRQPGAKPVTTEVVKNLLEMET